MKGAIAWFTDNPVAANLLMVFLLVAGLAMGVSSKVEIFPETSLDIIRISTPYPGASPAEVEEGVVRRIEERIAGLAGIERIDSTSREGSGTVTVEVMQGWDLQSLLDEIKAEVDRITTLPDEAEEPLVREVTRRRDVLDLAIYGDAPESTIKYLAEQIRDDITNLSGVTLASLEGVRESEIHIEVGETTLRRYGLTLGQVAEAVRKGSLDLPAGSIKTAGGEILIRTKGRRYLGEEYGDIPVITKSDGTKVRLDDIAELKDGYEDTDLFARFQGKPAAIINVYRVADQNALKVADAVKAYVETIRPTLPDGIRIDIRRDRSNILKSRIELLTKNLLFGLVLVILMLALFLDLRLAFWVTLGIPVSFATGFLFLPNFDVSINMISLFAFIMVLGIVVDDAIIVGENVFRYYEEGKPALSGAVEGTVEVGRPVVFSVLTTIVAFWPLLMAGGTMGKLMRNIPIVVMVVLVGSLVESLFILPAHLRHSREKAIHRDQRREKAAARWLKQFIYGPYARLTTFCVEWRYATVALGISLILITMGLWSGGWIKFTFFPKVEGDTLRASLTMPVGTPVQQTQAVAERLIRAGEAAIAEAGKDRPSGAPPLLEYTMALVGTQRGGGRGSHLAEIRMQLLDGEERGDISALTLNRMWREHAGPIPEAESVLFRGTLHSTGNPVEVHLSSDNNDQLIAASEMLKSELGKIPGVFDIDDSFLPGKTEMQLQLKPAASLLGLTLNDLARQVRDAFYGAEALRLQRDQDEVKVKIRYPDAERRSLSNIESMYIRAPDGTEVPFSQVAEVRMEEGYASIQRAQRRRVIKVFADVDESVANANEIRQNLIADFLPRLAAEYPDTRYTLEGEGKEQKDAFADVYRGFVIALFCIYALLAIPFKSFAQPIIVMSAIPFGIIGAIFGHLIMGFNVSIMSVFGLVGLSGVVVNDSLVLIHRANRIRQDGFSVRDSAVLAGCMRFRAVILTSLTTFAGLTPMLLERSIQAQFLIPMAVSLGFGVLFATFITLLMIPCGYVIQEDLQNVARRLRGVPIPVVRP